MTSRIFFAAYGIHTNEHELKRKISGDIVARGYIDNYDLEFRSFPTIKESQGDKVPVVIWSIPQNSMSKLDRIEFAIDGLFRQKYLKVTVTGIADKGMELGVPRETVEALVYVMSIPNSYSTGKPSLPDYNLIFSGWQSNELEVNLLVRALLAADTHYEEKEIAEWERQQLLKSLVIARDLLNIKPENSPSNS
ncbi:gamma-glutamylcyclotransferase family protein [Paenibacillus piri]|uniref:Gamma-glutamylcyclotransferase n=1 Tax=Paenibacillus piri TaxID=2547395 RepID=A0A4R5KXT6_9BACL|nr:gamma-glutamylcyclotransferase family protein [Paenibacillus piri]TDG00892.1 gamma-glutamylcyclotransferase [Paenibacillus piri]